jgi:hypothetical protein
MKERISFIELAFRQKHANLARTDAELPNRLREAAFNDGMPPLRGFRVLGKSADSVKADNDHLNSRFRAAADELNTRMRQAGYDLHYHNGFIQRSADPLLEREVEQSFWSADSRPQLAER